MIPIFMIGKKNWLTFEEVKDDELTRPVQTKKVLGVDVGAGASQFG